MRSGRQKVLVFVVLGLIFGLTGFGVYHVWRQVAAPQPPTVPLQGVDPEIAAAVQNARGQVLRSPYSGPDWGILGTVLYVHNFQPQAAYSFHEAERFDPREPRWPYLRALCLLQQTSDPSQALPDLRRAAALAGDTPDAPRLLLAETLLDLGRPDEAEPLLRQAAGHDPGSARALLGLGRLALARGNLAEANDDLLKSYHSAPGVKATQLLLAQTFQRLGDVPTAGVFAKQAATLSDQANWPDTFATEAAQRQVGKVAQIQRSENFLVSNQFDAAVTQMEQTVREYPDSGRAWMLLGAAYTGRGEPAAGEKALRKALLLDPGSAETLNHLGNALARQGRVVEAATYFRKALALNPQSAEYHFNLGVCLYLEHKSTAIKEFETSIRLDPDAVKGHASLADALAQDHQTAAAIQQLQIGLRLNPHDPILEKSLARLQGAPQVGN